MDGQDGQDGRGRWAAATYADPGVAIAIAIGIAIVVACCCAFLDFDFDFDSDLGLSVIIREDAEFLGAADAAGDSEPRNTRNTRKVGVFFSRKGAKGVQFFKHWSATSVWWPKEVLPSLPVATVGGTPVSASAVMEPPTHQRCAKVEGSSPLLPQRCKGWSTVEVGTALRSCPPH